MSTDTSRTAAEAGSGASPSAEPSARLQQMLSLAADRFGTPLYVTDVAGVTSAATAVEAAFPEPWVHQYSLKANDLPAVAEVLAGRGWGANVVSAGEWASARAAGIPPDRTTFEGVGKTDADLLSVVDAAVAGTPLRWVAVESADELVRLAELHELRRAAVARDVDLPVLLRLNPDVQPETRPGLAVGLSGSKFGLSAEDVVGLASSSLWRGGLRLLGIHVHMGSLLRDVSAWATAGCRGVALLERVRATYSGPGTPEVVDFGGGFPAHGTDPAPSDFAAALADGLQRAGLELPPAPAIEPGRVVIGAAGWLVASVLHTRRRGDDRQVILDAGMTELIRPALYGVRHRVSALGGPGGELGEVGDVVVEGAVCESTDTFGVHSLPQLRRGDRVVIHEAGAYSASFSSRYNGRPAAPEALLWPDGSLSLGQRSSPPAPRRLADLIRTVDGVRSSFERSQP